MGKSIGIHIHTECIVLHIVGKTHIPPVEDAHFIGHCQVAFLLQILVFYMDEFVIIIDVSRIVVGVFGIDAQRPSVE